MLTEFDRKAWRELHLYKLPEFIKVLEGCNHLQNIQQSEKKHTHTHAHNETSRDWSWEVKDDQADQKIKLELIAQMISRQPQDNSVF